MYINLARGVERPTDGVARRLAAREVDVPYGPVGDQSGRLFDALVQRLRDDVQFYERF